MPVASSCHWLYASRMKLDHRLCGRPWYWIRSRYSVVSMALILDGGLSPMLSGMVTVSFCA